MFITGASGAIPRSDIAKQEAHAKLYYEEIRKRTGDIRAVAKNSGFPIEDVRKIKNHMFMNAYDLGEAEPSLFDPNYDMAISWQRLIDGKDIREMDMVLLRHERMEYELMNVQKLDYRTAHEMSEAIYDYAKYIRELDREEGIK